MPKVNVDLNKLVTAMQHSRLGLRRPRENRTNLVREFVGPNWSEEGASKPVHVNLLSLYVQVVARNLISKHPRISLSTFDDAVRPVVGAMEAWANQEIQRMHMASTLQRIAVDALFSIGIAKVSLATPAQSAITGWQQSAGEPLVQRVDLDDFVFDTHAKTLEEVSFIGHRYRAPLELIKNSPLYGPQRKELAASVDQLYNLEGDERITVLGRGMYGDQEEFEDFVDLWEIYLPRHRLVYTLADDYLTGPGLSDKAKALRVAPWLGRDAGPYHILAYGVVPGNAMPKAPMQDLLDLHLGANRTYRKIVRVADRIKELLLVQGGAMEDGSRTQQASDGDVVRCDNPEAMKQVVMGGNAVQVLIASATMMKDLFSFMGGNLELLGGRGPQSKTATQDEMLNQNAGAGIADMQDTMVEYTSEVLRSLCWYWWHDPRKVQRSRFSMPGLPEIAITRQVTPAMRQRGRWEDIDVQVDPYSLRHQTPQQRMAAINQVVQQTIIPMSQLLQQQGIALDVNAYLQKLAKYMDMPDLTEIVTTREPPQEQPPPSGGGSPPTMPAQTERHYVRENRPGRTRQGDDSQLIAAGLGQDRGGNPNSNGVMKAMGVGQ